jgi:hypothetical protein
MSPPVDREFRLFLARAFDLAWNRYYAPRRGRALSEEIARSALAKHLVAKAKEGVKEEDTLAEDGLQHLILLTLATSRFQSQNFNFQIVGAYARFLRQWRTTPAKRALDEL